MRQAFVLSLLLSGLITLSTSNAHAKAYVEDEQQKKPFSTLLEAGPSYKIFGAKEDTRKIINTSLMQTFQPFFHQLSLGGWIGGRDPGAVFSYSLGIKIKSIMFYSGYSYLTQKNDSIGTHWGFNLGAQVELDQAFLGFKHYSNGAKLFDHNKKPNYGLNFVTLGVHV